MSFDAVLATVEAAQVQLVNGQPGPFKALWSRGEDVTMSGGLGGAIARGWVRVSERLDWVATQYAGGRERIRKFPATWGRTSHMSFCGKRSGSRTRRTDVRWSRNFA
jgi:hypothetical protein